jgi:hypothetical protein
MTDLRKRILAGGILALCLLSLFWTDYRDHKVIGLTELVALCGSWACAVWLWSAHLIAICKAWGLELLRVLRAFGIVLGGVSMIVGGVAILYAVSHPHLMNDPQAGRVGAFGILASISGFTLFAVSKWRDKKP